MVTSNNNALDAAKKSIKTYTDFKAIQKTMVDIVTGNTSALIFRSIFLIAIVVALAALKRYMKNLREQQATILTDNQKRELENYIQGLELSNDDSVFDQENNL